MKPAEFTDILEQCLEGRASRSDQRRLAVATARSPALLRDVRNAVRDDWLLRSLSGDAVAFAGRTMGAITHQGSKSQFVEELMSQLRDGREADASSDPRRLAWRRPVWLAAAAALLLALGLFAIIRGRSGADAGLAFPSRNPIGHIRQQIGSVTVNGQELATAAGSFCRLELDDGTIVAMDENTRIQADSKGTDLIAQDSGRLYLDVKKRQAPLTLRTGDGQMEILGTRVLTQHADGELVAVLEGRARYTFAGQSAVVGTSQMALPWSYSGRQGRYVTGLPGGMEKPTAAHISVGRIPVNPDAIDWIRKLGLNPVGLAETAWNAQAPTDGLLEILNYQVENGRWDVLTTGANGSIRQDDASAGLQSTLKFVAQKWNQGLLTFRFRVLDTGVDRAGVSVGFDYDNKTRDLVKVSDVPGLLNLKGRWIRVNLPFEISARNELRIPNMMFWPEDSPTRIEQRSFVRSPDNSDLRVRTACSLALATDGCSAEFRDLVLSRTGMPLETDRLAGSLENSLLALYRFNGSEGTRIRNTLEGGREDSGKLDLTIKIPERIRWTGHAMELSGPADVTLDDTAGLLGEAWRRNKGLSFEIWYSSVRQRANTRGYLFSLLQAGRYSFTWSGYPSDWPGDVNLFHVSHAIFDDASGKMQGRFYNNGLLAGTNSYSAAMGPWITRGNTQFVLFPEMKGISGELPISAGVKIHALAIYDRPLNAAEMREAFMAGPPGSQPASEPVKALGLYRFLEGTGTRISDRAPGGVMGSFDIVRPEFTEWTPRGLKVNAGADITWVDTGRQLKKAWAESKGLTFELWFRFPRGENVGNKPCTYAHIGAGPFQMAFSSPPLADTDPEKLRCGVYTIQLEQGKTRMRFYADGRLQNQSEMPDFTPLLNLPVELRIGPSVKGKPASEIGSFEVCGAAVLGRALTEREVRNRFAFGLPEAKP